MAARQTRGRQRIPMRLIQNQDDLYASFSKRRLGLFKKASELSTLCGADVGVIVFSPTDNPFSFFSPTMDSVVDRYLTPDRPLRHSARAIDSHTRARIHALNKRLDDLLHQKLHLKDYLQQLDQPRDRAWWEDTPLDKDQVREWTAWFENLKARVEDKVAQLRNGGSTSSTSIQGHVAAAAPPSSYYGADQFAPPLNFLNSPPMDPLYRGITHVGGGGGPVFSSQFRYYVSSEGGGGGGGSGESVFPAAAYVDQSGGLMPPSHGAIFPSTNMCFPPNYLTVASGIQNPSATATAAGEEEAAASNQGGN